MNNVLQDQVLTLLYYSAACCDPRLLNSNHTEHNTCSNLPDSVTLVTIGNGREF